MEPPDSLTRRRAILGGVGTLLMSGGSVYGASRLESSPVAPTAAPFHASAETTDFGIDLCGHPIMGSLDAPVDIDSSRPSRRRRLCGCRSSCVNY